MAGYLIVTMRSISDPEKLQQYREAAAPTVSKFGGKAIVTPRNSQEFVEGEQGVCVVMYRFPSYQRAVDWYNSAEYRSAMEIRLGAADVQIALAEGME